MESFICLSAQFSNKNLYNWRPKTSNLIKPLQADSINVNKALDLQDKVVTELRNLFNTQKKKKKKQHDYIVTYFLFNL